MTAAVAVSDVTLVRDGRAIFSGFSADFEAGALTAVTGPSGSGKSTLLALVAGLEQPDVGRIERRVPQAETGLVLQNHGLVRLLTAAENVELALQARGLPRAEVMVRAANELERFGLAGLADRRPDEMSGGQQQRLAIARALVIEPRLVIADELTSELDPRNRARVLDAMIALRDHGVTVVIATHDSDIARRGDHVVRVGGAPSTTELDSRSARRSFAEHRLAAQERRIEGQRRVVAREQASLAEMEHVLQRLRDSVASAEE